MHIHISKQQLALAGSALGVSLLSLSGMAAAASAKNTATSTNDQQRIATIISKGDQEISRRLTTLNTLTSKITAASKLNSTDKASLSSEVSNEVSGLTSLKTKLDAETTLSAARADAQSIYSDYRVYALIVPKIQLIKTADDQQVVEAHLSDLAGKLQTRLNTAKAAGKDVTSLQTQLTDMQTQTSNAQAISSAIEAKVSGLQPNDYDSNHAVLSGDAAQLKTAHSNNQAAEADAKAIVAAVQNL